MYFIALKNGYSTVLTLTFHPFFQCLLKTELGCFCFSVQMKGDAEAFALEAKGRAEAEQMAKKADAFKQYQDGAMVDMLLEKLPLVSLTPTNKIIKNIL